MDIFTSTKPEVVAAHAMTETFKELANKPVLLLLAGGSALTVLKHIDTQYIHQNTTIMMMDERFSRKKTENNFLQMTDTSFYKKLSKTKCQFISSLPAPEESHLQFAQRMENNITSYLENHTLPKILALFGIGSDGHTAAIFPMSLEDFSHTYQQGNYYTKVIYEKNPFTYRATITPSFIQKYITHSFVYAVGEQKLPILKALTEQHTLHTMPAYIHTLIQSKLYTDQQLSTYS